MAYEGSQITIGTLTASADLSAKQYYFVKLASATTVAVCSAVTDKPIGVLQNAPTSGQAAEVCVFGISKISLDGTTVAGNLLGTAADGQAAVYTTTDTTKYVCGQAIEAGAANGIATAFVNITNSRFV
ncbi:hypothetical protein UFOVP1219_70 [uncultured Caudovirales phage]|uniref:DUF2190 family protein n=1 Tax=uncultured Caudovirales phage TaxID=2100421 RepID=A0A6J5RAK4_9CAUD|nr:hypothetical protein UFOVP476_42 [uncultured Caudovirales phage]CAB4176439.1 hypothetical protein UFOVP986_33 [uncultured Caudovirales phage]CAB4191586.1 hypothetical protein UFOVP1219_70 [uncultured Caudovirales phage]CAB4223329.1 hypothetical protein UFOVP1671_45 [uncultured Caudovirales phage]CAB5220559.1 hypothetical protein UFOVP358_62 [uncultured Caudovirales phage]